MRLLLYSKLILVHPPLGVTRVCVRCSSRVSLFVSQLENGEEDDIHRVGRHEVLVSSG